jgi:cysteinyl-tRNA synthetase
LGADERRWLALDVDLILGLDLHRVWSGPANDRGATALVAADDLVAARERARREGDYATADALRETLRTLGVFVADAAIPGRRDKPGPDVKE